MVNRNEDRERRWRRSEREKEWGGRTGFRGSNNRGYGRQMDDEDRGDFARDRGRSFNRQWDDEDRWSQPERGEWDYEGPYYNRGSFNPGWEMDPDSRQSEPYDYRYDRDYSSSRGYGYGRDYGRSMGHDYNRGSFNHGRGGSNEPLERGWRSRDAGLENDRQGEGYRGMGRDWEIEDEWDEDTEPAYWVYEEWWLVPGPFTGVGPRGYQRSDERIREDVCERLTQHGQIDASDVDIDVSGGEVTLKGTVDNRRAKRLAEDILEDIPGVFDIHNELRVRQTENRMVGNIRGGGQGWQSGHENRMIGNIREGSQGWQSEQETDMGLDKGNIHQTGTRDTIMPGRIREGMEVVGSDGERVGKVKEVRSNDFLVDRPMARDLYIPFTACKRTNGEIMLQVRANEVSAQDWPAPSLFGAGDEGQEGMTG